RDQAVERELALAEAMRGQAANVPPARRPSLLAEALAAVGRADGLLGDASESLKQRVQALAAALHQEERDLRMLARREEVRLTGTEVAVRPSGAGRSSAAKESGRLKGTAAADYQPFDQTPRTLAYARAFREYGIDVEQLPPAVVGERLHRGIAKSHRTK